MSDTSTELPLHVPADQVAELITALVLLVAPLPAEQPAPSLRLVGDLGYHSLALAELGFTLEDLFHMEAFNQETALSLERIEQITDLIAKDLAAGTASLPESSEAVAVMERYGSTWPRA